MTNKEIYQAIRHFNCFLSREDALNILYADSEKAQSALTKGERESLEEIIEMNDADYQLMANEILK